LAEEETTYSEKELNVKAKLDDLIDQVRHWNWCQDPSLRLWNLQLQRQCCSRLDRFFQK
jgi:hypothetical protein